MLSYKAWENDQYGVIRSSGIEKITNTFLAIAQVDMFNAKRTQGHSYILGFWTGFEKAGSRHGTLSKLLALLRHCHNIWFQPRTNSNPEINVIAMPFSGL